MESASALDSSSSSSLQRLWSRRLTASIILDENDLSELLSNSEAFPSAQLAQGDVDVSKSRACSPLPVGYHHDNYLLPELDHEPCYDLHKSRPSFDCTASASSSSSSSFSSSSKTPLLQTLDASSLGDIPTQYVVPTLKPYEMPVVGLYIDPRVVCGFRYRVRRIDDKTHLFNKQALELQSIGRGYSRRLTFAGGKGRLNDNDNYFWSDSFPSGFAFELEVISPGEKFTIHDPSNLAVGFLEILNCTKPQEEVNQTIKKNGAIEKTVRVHLLCKVEWFDENGPTPVIPVTGLAIATRCRGSAEVTKVVSVNIGSHARRGFTLTPGIGSHKRSTTVKGALVGDVPTVYTVLGLEPYELPVVGTYVDPRIMPGFLYRVRPTGLSRRHLFDGQALRLQSIGAGYGKRLTFAPSPKCLNSNDNFFWSDSYADGLGFEPRAVEAGAKFVISTSDGLKLGKASVFRADAPQYQEREEIMGNMRGSVSTPDTEPLTPEYENNYFSHFFESNLDSSSQSAANDALLSFFTIPNISQTCLGKVFYNIVEVSGLLKRLGIEGFIDSPSC
ncbi:hypothetical protein LSTR_LSTR013133 [Laodelphax striatellus]|uniref:Uncharacterized protein n=1 Tax=Laodelphax striatellus TaxID=195883 RepID=A0A482X4F2_LAOST|nr:hypothetical protein LSTR_LSTR013133 [Laodelphax striatellus]